jgi:hypothetical protein
VFAALCFDLDHGAVDLRPATAFALCEILSDSKHEAVRLAASETQKQLAERSRARTDGARVKCSALAPLLFAAWKLRCPMLDRVCPEYTWRCASPQDRATTTDPATLPIGRTTSNNAAVLAVLNEAVDWITAPTIVAKCKIPLQQVHRALRSLESEGLAQHWGGGAFRRYARAGLIKPTEAPGTRTARQLACADLIINSIKARPGEVVPWTAIEIEAAAKGYSVTFARWVRTQLVARGEVAISGSVIEWVRVQT